GRPSSVRYQSAPVKCWRTPYAAATAPATTITRASRTACAGSRSHQKTTKYASAIQRRTHPLASSGCPLASVERAMTPAKSASTPSSGVRRTTPHFPTSAAQLKAALVGKDRKSTRLNSSHVAISYAVFCLKKKNTRRVAYVALRQVFKPRQP